MSHIFYIQHKDINNKNRYFLSEFSYKYVLIVEFMQINFLFCRKYYVFSSVKNENKKTKTTFITEVRNKYRYIIWSNANIFLYEMKKNVKTTEIAKILRSYPVYILIPFSFKLELMV